MERMYLRGEKKNTVIGIRADGNSKLGMGHLMRCLSIALAFREYGFCVVFVTAEDAGSEIIKGRGFEQIVLNSDYTCMEAECDALQAIIQERDFKLLLVDSYQITSNYLKKIKEWAPVVCLEEDIKEEKPVDGIINYNVYAPHLPYDSKYGKEVKKYLGSLYAPLRPEFSRRIIPIREQVKRILITMGGSDEYNLSGSLLKKILSQNEACFKEIEYEVICGNFNPHYEELKQLTKRNPQLHIRASVENMAELMEKCDIAVSAAGSTMYELAALGVPTVCCYYVDNQKKIAEGFSKLTKVINAGDYTIAPEAVLEEMVRTIRKFLQSKMLRAETAESMRTISDGRGAKRLVEDLQRDFLLERKESKP